MDGLHLSGLTEAIISETIADMEQFGLQLFAPGHCTGWRAIAAMERAFKDKVVPLAVGKRFAISHGLKQVGNEPENNLSDGSGATS